MIMEQVMELEGGLQRLDDFLLVLHYVSEIHVNAYSV